MLILFNKPYGVITQFTPEPGSKHGTLSTFSLPEGVYPVGRLDADSEGMLLLTDEADVTTELFSQENVHKRTYLVQVEGDANIEALHQLEVGVRLKEYTTKPANVRVPYPQPDISERVPPIRFRKSIPTTWIELDLIEGKNRQVRRMTAAVGFPTLRLLRIAIGGLRLGDLRSGQWRELTAADRLLLFGRA